MVEARLVLVYGELQAEDLVAFAAWIALVGQGEDLPGGVWRSLEAAARSVEEREDRRWALGCTATIRVPGARRAPSVRVRRVVAAGARGALRGVPAPRGFLVGVRPRQAPRGPRRNRVGSAAEAPTEASVEALGAACGVSSRSVASRPVLRGSAFADHLEKSRRSEDAARQPRAQGCDLLRGRDDSDGGMVRARDPLQGLAGRPRASSQGARRGMRRVVERGIRCDVRDPWHRDPCCAAPPSLITSRRVAAARMSPGSLARKVAICSVGGTTAMEA